MKLKYPAEAFALGIILFSAGMREAFAAGSLLILSAVFAVFLKNLLKDRIPEWSLWACVLIGSGSVCASAFTIGFAAFGTALTAGTWGMAFVAGLLCGRFALALEGAAEYGELFYESAIAWGMWILFAIAREFAGAGMIFGNSVYKATFQSGVFLESTFAFLTAGLVLALTNGLLKKSCKGLNSLFVFIPAAILVHPFTMNSFGELVGIFWVILVPVVLFLSVRQTLRFSRSGKYYRGLPVEMLAAGFIYMILSIY